MGKSSQLCLRGALFSSFPFSPFSLASKFLLKTLLSYITFVQIRQRIQGTALTTPISKPFWLPFLHPTLPTPPGSKVVRRVKLPIPSPDFSYAAEMSRRKVAVTAWPLPSMNPQRGVRIRARPCSITMSVRSDTLTGIFSRP